MTAGLNQGGELRPRDVTSEMVNKARRERAEQRQRNAIARGLNAFIMDSEIDLDDPLSVLLLGLAHFYLGDVESAAEHWKRAIELDTDGLAGAEAAKRLSELEIA